MKMLYKSGLSRKYVKSIVTITIINIMRYLIQNFFGVVSNILFALLNS